MPSHCLRLAEQLTFASDRILWKYTAPLTSSHRAAHIIHHGAQAQIDARGHATTKKREAEVLKAQSPAKVTKNASPAKRTPGKTPTRKTRTRKTPTRKMTDMQESMAKSATESGKKTASPAKPVSKKTTGSAKVNPDDDDDDPLGTKGLYVTAPASPPKRAATKKRSSGVKDKTYKDDHDPGDDAVEDEPEPERPRRAARKGSVYKPDGQSEEDDEPQLPVKRARGRPRKDGTVAASSSKKTTAKGGTPGRPKKKVAVRVEEALEEAMLDVDAPDEDQDQDGRPTIANDPGAQQPRKPSRSPAKTSADPAAQPGPILDNAQTRLTIPRASPAKGRGTAGPSLVTKPTPKRLKTAMTVTPRRGSGDSLGSFDSACEAAASAAQLRREAEAAAKLIAQQAKEGGGDKSPSRISTSRPRCPTSPSDNAGPLPSRTSPSPPPRPPPDRSGITGPPFGDRQRLQAVLRRVATAEEQRVFDGYEGRVVVLPRKYY
ncbi:hypothetical protein Tdes44962_MAKER09875 [Teratosphaeria destructans]|uniref:Uncharacterized protein n=1 Tax=Teratosphaeria destructans TaxID=418781 RepID=A0A9W7SR58_9PEZI|nr:hypothetical protein Tdes44962_MAKER09875 [Teratosphaeria destructans]